MGHYFRSGVDVYSFDVYYESFLSAKWVSVCRWMSHLLDPNLNFRETQTPSNTVYKVVVKNITGSDVFLISRGRTT